MRARRPVVRNRPKIGHQDPEAPVWQVRSQFATATGRTTGVFENDILKNQFCQAAIVAALLKAEIGIHCNAQ
jgi:hypothetical protein